jgi:hypothetical protein
MAARTQPALRLLVWAWVAVLAGCGAPDEHAPDYGAPGSCDKTCILGWWTTSLGSCQTICALYPTFAECSATDCEYVQADHYSSDGKRVTIAVLNSETGKSVTRTGIHTDGSWSLDDRCMLKEETSVEVMCTPEKLITPSSELARASSGLSTGLDAVVDGAAGAHASY